MSRSKVYWGVAAAAAVLISSGVFASADATASNIGSTTRVSVQMPAPMRILYDRNAFVCGCHHSQSVNLDGSDMEYHGKNRSATPSPDREHTAIVADGKLVIGDAVGDQTGPPIYSFDAGVEALVWTPDGSEVLIQEPSSQGGSTLTAVTLDGSSTREISVQTADFGLRDVGTHDALLYTLDGWLTVPMSGIGESRTWTRWKQAQMAPDGSTTYAFNRGAGPRLTRLPAGGAVDVPVDPVFGSGSWVYAGGGWSADGGRFAVGLTDAGDRSVVVLDRRGRIRHEVPTVGNRPALFPALSPDGNLLAYNDKRGAVLHDLTRGTRCRVVRDDSPMGQINFARVEFTPDGRRIVIYDYSKIFGTRWLVRPDRPVIKIRHLLGHGETHLIGFAGGSDAVVHANPCS